MVKCDPFIDNAFNLLKNGSWVIGLVLGVTIGIYLAFYIYGRIIVKKNLASDNSSLKQVDISQYSSTGIRVKDGNQSDNFVAYNKKGNKYAKSDYKEHNENVAYFRRNTNRN